MGAVFGREVDGICTKLNNLEFEVRKIQGLQPRFHSFTTSILEKAKIRDEKFQIKFEIAETESWIEKIEVKEAIALVHKDVIDHTNRLERLELGEDLILSRLDNVLSNKEEFKFLIGSLTDKLDDVKKRKDSSQRKI